MKVIRTYKDKRPGNDCYIEESYSLIESLDGRYILKHYKASGDWFENIDTFSNFTIEEARKYFSDIVDILMGE